MKRKIHAKLLWATLPLIFVLSGCETSPTIQSNTEQNTDFTRYRTFAFLDKLTPKGQQYSTLTGKYLRLAISEELRRRGLSESEDADLLVGFYVHTQEKIESHTTPSTSVGYYGYRSRYGYGWGVGTETRVTQYTEGTLNIDVVDRARKQLIWEGIAIGRLKKKAPENLQQRINDVVTLIFEEYPLAAQP